MSILEHSIMQLSGRDGTAEFDVDPERDVLKMTVGKETRTFKFVDLFALVFAIAGPEQQASMMPVRQTEVMTYRRIHNYKLKKAQPAGAVLRIPCEINVEKTVVEGLGGIVKKQEHFDGGIPIIGRGNLAKGSHILSS